MKTQTAALSEIFSSLQGEGTHLGERHIFVRFEACNIHCDYCDELGKPGFDFDLEEAAGAIRCLDQEAGPHSFVSFTGGEPLLYVSFLKPLMKKTREIGLGVYLETNGILWKALDEVIEWVEVVAMDLKPASVTGERSFLQEHQKFLRRALKKETFIKIVCSKNIDTDEFVELCEMVRACDRTTPLILQPISGEIEGHEDRELMQLLDQLQRMALGLLQDVRVVPRLHKILNIR